MKLPQRLPDLPVAEALPRLRATLAASGQAVLAAPPGSGKTTLVPLALLDEPWLAGKKILMLEPRRIAARASAARMAWLLGERVGETVGYQIRFEKKLTAATRIEVITEGLLTRRLQADPELPGVGLVIFDEFHERSLDADLALALTLDARANLNDSLRLLVMSATLDTQRESALFNNAEIIESGGKLAFPVDVRYHAAARRRRYWARRWPRPRSRPCPKPRATSSPSYRAAARSAAHSARSRRGWRIGCICSRCSATCPAPSRTPPCNPPPTAAARSSSPPTSPRPASPWKGCAR